MDSYSADERLELGFREADALRVARDVASALSYTEVKGVVHCDIKPSNILLTPDGTAKLTDFGIAKLRGGTAFAPADGETLPTDLRYSITEPGGHEGTVFYMSPEQVRGDRLSIRSDMYSLGVSLYQMLTGRLPFTGESKSEVYRKIKSQRPPDPREHVDDLSESTVELVLKMLEKKPSSRHHSAEQLTERITAILDEERTDMEEVLALLKQPAAFVMAQILGPPKGIGPWREPWQTGLGSLFPREQEP